MPSIPVMKKDYALRQAPTFFTPAARAWYAGWVSQWVLKDAASVIRNTPVSTPSGGRKDDWATVEETRVCVLDAGSPAQQIVAAREVGYTVKLVLLPLGTDVRREDRIQIANILYHILDVFDPGTYEVTQRVSVRSASIQGGT